MYDAGSLLARITQEQWDEFLAGKPLVSELVKQYKGLIVTMGFRDLALQAIAANTPEDVLARVEKERPDLRLGDRETAVERIRAEMAKTAEILKAE